MQDVANFARVSGGSGYIVGAMLHTDKKSIVPRFRVHLFNATGATVSADNAAFKDVYADISKRIGFFDLFSMITGTWSGRTSLACQWVRRDQLQHCRI